MSRRPSLSLRAKLTLLYVGLLALLLGALGGFLYLETREFLETTTVVRLRAQAKPVVDGWLARMEGGAELNGEPAPDLAATASELSLALTSRETTAVVYDATGTELADGRRLPEEPVPAPADPTAIGRALGGENEVTYTLDENGQRTLVALIPLRPEAGQAAVVGVVQLSAPLALVDAILWRQRALIGLGTLGTLILGIGGGLWLTSSALRPLRRMIGTCRRIAAGDLGQRVNLPARGDEIGELGAAFDEMATRIEASFAGQRRFIADAAHELRTPVTALSGSLEVLLLGAQDNPEAANRLTRGMHRDLERLRRMLEQLLDLSALEAAAPVELAPMALAPFVAGFTDMAQTLARERHLVLEPGGPAIVAADPDRLERALANLVDNAVQHTAADGIIRLGWQVEGGVVDLWVADNGEGIAPDDMPHLFETFYRGDRSRSRRRGGTGLGLALVQSIVEAHGGEVLVESRLGDGARFTIRLPAIVAATSSPAAPVQGSRA